MNVNRLEMSAEQLEQLERVEDAVYDLMDVMLLKPEYLREYGESVPSHSYQFHPLIIADLLAEFFFKHGTTVYYPTFFENADHERVLSDTYR